MKTKEEGYIIWILKIFYINWSYHLFEYYEYQKYLYSILIDISKKALSLTVNILDEYLFWVMHLHLNDSSHKWTKTIVTYQGMKQNHDDNVDNYVSSRW